MSHSYTGYEIGYFNRSIQQNPKGPAGFERIYIPFCIGADIPDTMHDIQGVSIGADDVYKVLKTKVDSGVEQLLDEDHPVVKLLTRISDLVMAVKKFAYDERTPDRDLDIHDNLQSTLTILGHKLRVKQIAIEKKFDASPSVIRTRGAALSQVWTNLIDNAADASADRGHIEIRTWNEPANGSKTAQVAVSVTDHGSGIPADVLPRIFDPFFTTKPQGSGTGLGLEIVHRIVTQKFGGTIDVESKPGHTVFTVRLPVTSPAVAQSSTMS